jgi:hypothetical protein
MATTALLGALTLASVVAGASRLLGVTRLALDMARRPTLAERRLALFGPWYGGVQQLAAATPRDATIDFVMIVPEARDIAVLGGADLQPRDVRFFDGWDAWKQRKRAEFLHDAHAANAATGAPPSPARFVVTVDPRSDPPCRLVHPVP